MASKRALINGTITMVRDMCRIAFAHAEVDHRTHVLINQPLHRPGGE